MCVREKQKRKEIICAPAIWPPVKMNPVTGRAAILAGSVIGRVRSDPHLTTGTLSVRVERQQRWLKHA